MERSFQLGPVALFAEIIPSSGTEVHTFDLFSCDLLNYSKTYFKRALKKKLEIGFQGRLSLNAGQKYCIMLQREHSAILSTFIKLPFVIYTFVLYIFEWSLKTGSLYVMDTPILFKGKIHRNRKGQRS